MIYLDTEMRSAIVRLILRWMAGCLGMAVAAVGLLWSPVQAQDNGDTDTTFTVTRIEKTDEHPYSGEGDNDGYAIDGVEGAEITLEQGTTYYFIMDGVETFHPFYISTDSVGQGQNIYTDGVSSTWTENDRAAESDTLIFTPGESAPDTLWYACTNHELMGYRINIADPTSTDIDDAVANQQLPSEFILRGNYPNPFNPSTTIQFDLPASADVRVDVYDMLGQRVETIRAGQMAAGADRSIRIDASSYSSGMYLYRVRATTPNDVMAATGRMMLVK